MNKADPSIGYARMIKGGKLCVFLSHKKEDQHIAIELGNFLMNQLGVDIYLDVFDSELSEAISTANDSKIVSSITHGLKISHILLCIVSDKTRLSWWVPYEIGVADCSDIKVVSLRTKQIDDFPSFLKTKETVNSLATLVEYILKHKKYGSLFYSEQDASDILREGIGSLDKHFE